MERLSKRFVYPKAAVMDFSKTKSLTQQQFKDEADINVVMSRFSKTGVLGNPESARSRTPKFGDFSNVDFQSASEVVANAQSDFEGLPSDVRAKFGNDVQELLDFVADPANKDSAISMGLLPKDPENAVSNEPSGSPVAPVEPPATPDGDGVLPVS